MSMFTVVVSGLPQLSEALTRTNQFAAVHPIGSTNGLRQLLGSPAFSSGTADKVFIFSDTTVVDTDQTLEFLVGQLARMGARVIVVATSPRGNDLVTACPQAGLLMPPLKTNTVMGALSGMGVPVIPVAEPANVDLSLDPAAGPLAANMAPEPNPFAGHGTNPFGSPAVPAAAQPAPMIPAPATGPVPTQVPSEAAQDNPFARPAFAPQQAPFAPAPAAASPAVPTAQTVLANPFAAAGAASGTAFAPVEPQYAPVAEQGNPFAAQAPSTGFAAQQPSMPAPTAPNPFAQTQVHEPAPLSVPANPFAVQQPANQFGAPTSPFSAGPLDTPPSGMSQLGGAPPMLRTLGDATGGNASFNQRPQRRGFVVTVTAPKGGTGKSSLVINLAAYMALRLRESGKNVAIIDANVQQADTGKYIDAFHPNIEDVLRDSSSIHPDRIGNYLVHRPEANLSALLGPATPDSANPLYFTGEKYSQILEAMRPNFDYIFVDTPVAELYHDIFRTFAIPKANFIIVAVAPNHATVVNADSWLRQVCAPRQAGGMGLDPNKIGIVLNRAEDDIAYDEAEVIANLSSWNYLGAIPETKEWKRANNNAELVAHRNYHELNAAFNNVLAGATHEELLQTTPHTLASNKAGLLGKVTALLKKAGK